MIVDSQCLMLKRVSCLRSLKWMLSIQCKDTVKVVENWHITSWMII